MTDRRPSLENISDAATGERRRMPRLNLTSELFRVHPAGKVFSVVDLSSGGMALRVVEEEDLYLFPIGAEVQGHLNLRGNKCEVQARVRRLGGELVGLEFDSLEPGSSSTLKKYLDPSELGRELRPIPSSEGLALWFHGPSGTDALFWRGAGGEIAKAAVFLLGSYIQWEKDKGLSTGKFSESYEKGEVHGALRFDTLLLEADPKPDRGKLDIAKTLVLSSNLSQELKDWWVKHGS